MYTVVLAAFLMCFACTHLGDTSCFAEKQAFGLAQFSASHEQPREDAASLRQSPSQELALSQAASGDSWLVASAPLPDGTSGHGWGRPAVGSAAGASDSVNTELSTKGTGNISLSNNVESTHFQEGLKAPEKGPGLVLPAVYEPPMLGGGGQPTSFAQGSKPLMPRELTKEEGSRGYPGGGREESRMGQEFAATSPFDTDWSVAPTPPKERSQRDLQAGAEHSPTRAQDSPAKNANHVTSEPTTPAISSDEKRPVNSVPLPLPQAHRSSRAGGNQPVSWHSGSSTEGRRWATSWPSAVFIIAGAVVLLVTIGWITGSRGRRPVTSLSPEIFEVLGRAPLGPRLSLQLLRCGNRLVLIAITPEGVNTLSEITDPQEVTELLTVCRRNSPHAITESFRQLLDHLTRGQDAS